MQLTRERALEILNISNAIDHTQLNLALSNAREKCKTQAKYLLINSAYEFLYQNLSEPVFKKSRNAFIVRCAYIEPTRTKFRVFSHFQMFHFNNKNQFDDLARNFVNDKEILNTKFEGNLRHFEIVPYKPSKITEQGKAWLLDFLLSQPKLESVKFGNLFKGNESTQIKNKLKTLESKLNAQQTKADNKRFKDLNRQVKINTLSANESSRLSNYFSVFLIMGVACGLMLGALIINPAFLAFTQGASDLLFLMCIVGALVPSLTVALYQDHMIKKAESFKKTHSFDKTDKKSKKEPISEKQLRAIEAGIEAERSWSGYFTSYANSSTYYEREAFHTGRLLVLEDNVHKLNQVKKLKA